MRKILMMLLVLILAGCDDFCSAEKDQGHQEGYQQAGLDNQKLKDELVMVEAKLSETQASNERNEKLIYELRIKQDFNNRLYVAFVSSCHNFFIMNCGVVSNKYTELVKAGVTPAPGWIIGFDVIFLSVIMFLCCLLMFLVNKWLAPHIAEIERTQKYVDDVENAVAERLKLVSEDIFSRYEKAKLRQEQLNGACWEREDDLDQINDRFNEEYEKVQDLRDEVQTLEAEIQRRREIREVLRFDYEDNKD